MTFVDFILELAQYLGLVVLIFIAIMIILVIITMASNK